MSSVIAGKKATFIGWGTVNGSGRHRFRVIANDGNADGSGRTDEFRIKIWGNGSNSEANVIYENSRGVSQSSNLATVLVTGSIVIHKPSPVKAKTTSKVVATENPVLTSTKFFNYPNPYNDRTAITFSTEKEESFALEVYDVKGALVK